MTMIKSSANSDAARDRNKASNIQNNLRKASNHQPVNAIEIDGVSKIYKKRKNSGNEGAFPALDNVSLNIPRGSLFALLGPNGAGKSTLINILVGLVIKSAGNVRIWDYDIDKQTRQSRAAIGVVPQELNIDPFFTPFELLEVQAGLYGVPKSERRSKEILDMVGLIDKKDAYARSLSGGMRRRLLIAKALVHNPPVLVLDEPTAGVDIDLRRQLWDNVALLNEQGTTVLLTTHYLEEAEQLCDQVAIISHGKLVANESKRTLMRRLDAKMLVVTLAQEAKSSPDLPKSITDLSPIVNQDIETNRQILNFTFKPSETNAGEIIAAIVHENLDIVDITTQEADLEDIFLQLTK